jgi:hypothetical protein
MKHIFFKMKFGHFELKIEKYFTDFDHTKLLLLCDERMNTFYFRKKERLQLNNYSHLFYYFKAKIYDYVG